MANRYQYTVFVSSAWPAGGDQLDGWGIAWRHFEYRIAGKFRKVKFSKTSQ